MIWGGVKLSKSVTEFFQNPLGVSREDVMAGAQGYGGKFRGKSTQSVSQLRIGFVCLSIPFLAGPT